MPKKTQPLRLEWVNPADLEKNPKNWRTHSTAQMQGIDDAIDEVGWAGACLYNEKTKKLIDGHARRDIAIERGEQVPVLIGSWTPEQEEKILAVLDPLGTMADIDQEAFADLTNGMELSSGSLSKLVFDTRSGVNIRNEGASSKQIEEGKYPISPVFNEKYDYVVVFSANEMDWAWLQTVLELKREQSYTGKKFTTGRVIGVDKFRELWDSK